MSPAAPSQGQRALRRLPLTVELGIAVAAGLLHSQSFAIGGAWWLQLVSLAVLAYRVTAAGPRRAALSGLAFGTAWLSAATWWMYISLHDFGGLAAWMAALAVALLCAVLSLYLAAAMGWFAMRRRGRPVPDAMTFAAVWLLAELARGALFTGFPWAATGYAHTTGPLSSLAPWVGVYGIGCVAAFVAFLAARCLIDAHRSASLIAAGGAAAVLAVIAVAGPTSFTRATSTISVSLLQTNVAQDEKFSAERMPEALRWLSDHLLAARGDLVVAPETAIPLLPDQLAPQYWLPIVRHFEAGRQAALIGLPLGDPEAGYTNSVAGLSGTARRPAASNAAGGGTGDFYRYDKHHLVPFGEFVPTGFHWFVELMNIPLGDFARGPLAAPSFVVGEERVAPNICYEDLFGEELATRFTDAALAPTLFVNISNIGWFGNTVALHQHEEISRMRTLEFQRPMIRATNTGMTVVIAHDGKARERLPPYVRATLETSVQGRTGLTPFAYWSAWTGLWPLLVVGLVIACRPRRSNP